MVPVIVAALLAAAPGISQDSVVGTWKTETRNGIVDVRRCGASICGTVVTSDLLRTNPTQKDVRNKDASLRGRPIKGLEIVRGGSWDGTAWSGGTVYNPDDGNTYSGRITPIDADHLKLRGCVFFPLCRTQTWTRLR